MPPEAIEDDGTEPTVVSRNEIPICEDCGRIISARDIFQFRAEARVPDALPRICTDCAEAP